MTKVTTTDSSLLSAAHERIGAMKVALVAAQGVIDAGVYPRIARLIEAALRYEPTSQDTVDAIRDSLVPDDDDPNEDLGHGYGTEGL